MTRRTEETERALHLFRVLVRAHRSVVEHSVRDIKSHGLHPTEFAVLELLYHKGPQPLQRIATSILLASGSVTYVVDKLEKNGMLRREACPTDRRVVYAVLTDQGRVLLERIFPDHAEAIRRAVGGLSAHEQETLIALLKRMGLHAQRLLDETGVRKG